MTRAVTVKVKVADLVSALETTKKRLQSEIDAYDSLKAKHEKATKAWEAQVAKIASQGKGTVTEVRKYSWMNGEVRVELKFPAGTLPEQPTAPESVVAHDSSIQTIDNALKLLKMTTQEEVSTTAYKDIIDFI